MLLQTIPVQNWLIGKVTSRLSADLQTKVDIKHVDFSFFNKMRLQGVLVEDRKKDTILSAGEVVVNITDWFFLKKNIELKYIGLKDAYINLQRSDSVWRHQFLIEYFSTPGDSKPQKNNAINIAFKDVDLQNILVKQSDAWLGQDMTISLASLKTDPRNIDFNRKVIDINSIIINKPYFALRGYKGNKPTDTLLKAPPLIITDSITLDWNANKWNIKATKVSIKNGTFKNDIESRPLDPNGFDDKHIEFAKIYADFTNLLWRMDTITARVNLSTRERSGFEVKHLIADAKFTPKEMTFNNLDLRTNDSYLRNYFSMKYSSFDAMGDFITKVKMEANFYGTELNSDDIAYFAPAMKTWKKRITLAGKVSGPVAALVGKNLNIQAGNSTFFQGDAALNGLPDINTTFIDVKANPLKTTYADAIAFAPALKKITFPKIQRLQYVNFKGNYTGFIRDFVTFGNIETALGTVAVDVNMKLPDGKNPIYSGAISTTGFNLGALLDEPDVGYVSMNAKLKGAGFNPEKGNVALESNIRYFDYKKYRYQNIEMDGEFNKKIFDGNLKMKDPNVQLTLNGLINLANDVPKFDFLANIEKLNFKAIKLLEEDLSLTGRVNANFTGKNIDDFLGNANITHASLVKDGKPLAFDSLALTSNIVDGKKNLNVQSNEFKANLTGTFNISDLPNSITSFLTRYYPSYIKPPKTTPKNQVFSFDVTTYNVDGYAQLIDSSLSGFNNSHITGSINTLTNGLVLDVNVPYFKYAKYGFSNAVINAIGNYDSLTLAGRTKNITVGDSLNIPLATFDIIAQNDVSDVRIYSGGNSTVDQAKLNAIVKTYSNGVNILFEPSSFIINSKTWTIEDKGELEFRQNMPAHGQLVLRESTQEIRIKTQPSDVGNWNDIVVAIKNLNLGDIAPYILPSNRLEGLASANVLIENPGKSMRVISQDFIGKGIRFDNDSLGDISAKVLYDLQAEELAVNGKTLNPNQKNLAFDIHLYLKDKESQAKNIIALDANRFDLKYLNRFIGFLFSDISGEITGKFDIKGPLNALYVVGKGRLHDAGMKVNFTQCFYALEDKDIELTENEIKLSGMILRDTVTKNPVYLTGSVMHNAFQNMFLDITVSTRKPGTRDIHNNRPVQVLQTTYNDNKLFYGNVKATGSFVLIGYANEPYMKIDAIASEDYESNFTIASANSRAGKMPDWLVERKYGQAMPDSLLKVNESNTTYELSVTANPKVLMKFVMDDLTGDEIKGKGSGTLNIKSGSSDPLSIHGRFDIEEGTYNYTFQSFFKKPFEIIKGTENFISWNGSPTNATINFNAHYKAERVSFAPLAAGADIDASYANTRENVYVTSRLTGPLFKPDFQFGIELDPNSRYNNDFNVSNALQQIQRRPEEVTRQVTYLIVLNSFAPPQTGVSSAAGEFGSAVNEFTYNTISSLSGIFFNEVNKVLNNELAKLLGAKVSVVFSGSVYNRNLLTSANSGFNINQANVSGALRVPLFDDRFVISLGSSMEVPLQSTLQQSVQFLPDVTAEWLLNTSGSIRLNFFYRENLDFLTTSSSSAARLKRTGGGISFKKEFDNLRELFINVRKRTLKEIENTAKPQAQDSLKNVEPVINLKTKEDPLAPSPASKKTD